MINCYPYMGTPGRNPYASDYGPEAAPAPLYTQPLGRPMTSAESANLRRIQRQAQARMQLRAEAWLVQNLW